MSINIGPIIKGKVICELSDSDHCLHPVDITPRPGFTYSGIEVRKQNIVSTRHPPLSSPCKDTNPEFQW